ncbi:PTS sugar transporter subunit IIB [uncultured Thermanaerothrix sp.]|uniref:PTS sugar transporter subunit IIB n=1 Tax=uncultured Thermanaerothrix sp. TaxID=1195149 RepID=UPI00260D00FC|nr:PTS sugar transporter subunit IIB [uncultured Thermanaerothrix sp.]
MLTILTVCGVGMGSSLLLRMYTEDVLKELGIEAQVQASDATQARGARVDLILTSPALVPVCSGGHAPVRAIKSFVNKEEIRNVLTEFLKEKGLI